VDTRLPAIDANGSSSQATGPAREGEGNLATAGGDSVQGGESSTGAEGDGVLPSEKQKTLEKLLRGGRTNDNDDDNEGGAENEEAEKEGAATGKFMAEMLLAASWLNVDEVSNGYRLIDIRRITELLEKEKIAILAFFHSILVLSGSSKIVMLQLDNLYELCLARVHSLVNTLHFCSAGEQSHVCA
jgi:hypothetical protein